MINLLSKETKQELRAARRNVIIRKYVLTLGLLAVLIAGSYGVGYLILSAQEDAYKRELAQYIPQKEQYNDTIKLASEYTKNLAVAKSILENEVVFSDYIIMLARTLPPNTIMDAVNVKTPDFDKPIEATFKTKNYSDALVAKHTLESSPYFNDVKIRAIQKETNQEYAHRVIIQMKFDRAGFFKSGRQEVE